MKGKREMVKEFRKSWQIFKDSIFQAQQQSHPVSRYVYLSGRQVDISGD